MREQFGIDASKETLDVCYLKDIQLLTYQHKVVNNTNKGDKKPKSVDTLD